MGKGSSDARVAFVACGILNRCTVAALTMRDSNPELDAEVTF
jgi:hypothetical protein